MPRPTTVGLDDYTAAAADDWRRIVDARGQLPLEITMRLRRAAVHVDGVIAGVINATVLANYGDYEVLSALRRAGRSLTPRELAGELLITKAGMTGRLDRLEHGGLIQRLPNPADARSAQIELTARGTALVDDVFQRMVDAQKDMLSGLTVRQREQLANLLKQLLLSFEDVPPGSG